MLKYFFRLILLIAAFLGLIAGIGALLPRQYQVEASTAVKVPLEQLFEKFNRLPEWKDWSSWSPDVVPGLKLEYTGEAGVGSAMRWTELRGEGKLWITDSQPQESIDYRMTFANFPESSGRFEFAQQSDGLAQVKWHSHGSLPPGPFYGFWASYFSSHLQHEYQKSLEKLKTELEKTAQPSSTPAAAPIPVHPAPEDAAEEGTRGSGLH